VCSSIDGGSQGPCEVSQVPTQTVRPEDWSVVIARRYGYLRWNRGYLFSLQARRFRSVYVGVLVGWTMRSMSKKSDSEMEVGCVLVPI
jgi:hypothetical protein